MKKAILVVIMSFVCLGLMSSCVCSKGDAKPCKSVKSSMACKEGMSIDKCPVMTKLNLTAEQKSKVQAICDECGKEKCGKKACEKMTKELEKVLTAEQMAQYKAACEEMKAKSGCCMKAKKSGCPMMKSAEPVEESK